MSMVGFPLLLIPLAIYNIIVFLMPGVSLAEPLVTLPILTSGAQWPVTLSDVLVALGILMLLFEVMKGARPGAKFLTDHLLSFIVFGGAVAEFLLWPRFATSAFFLLTLLALVDFLCGVALRVKRGTPAMVPSGRAMRRAAVETKPEPADAPAGEWSSVHGNPGSAPSSQAPANSAHSETHAPSEAKFSHFDATSASETHSPSSPADGSPRPPSEPQR